MQTHIVKQMLRLSSGYVDPQSIAATTFNYPQKLETGWQRASCWEDGCGERADPAKADKDRIH